ncbi:MAG TPA: hypothetical protein PLS08_03845 [Chryseolinea sp.]|nr:hypothetical protein [Chryseolinea sp.]
MEKFKTFDDSLAGNPNFRRRILENVSTPEELQQLRENQGHELKKKFKDFRDTYPDSENMIMKHKILDGLDNLLSVVFVCMAIPLFIYLFKER